MSRVIKVSGACQAPGIAEALKLMLTSDDVAFVHTPRMDNEDAKESFIEQIKVADVWVTAAWSCADTLTMHNPALTVVRWPQLTFPAFHPDIVLACTDRHFITALGCVYNSAICLWGWINDIPPDRIVGLFCAETFKALGYLDFWNPSVATMRKDFVECDLNFERFFQPIKRQGVFMHSNLHAKLSPLLHLARQLAEKLGADRRAVDEPLEDYMADPLVYDAVWPVYPAIGDALGVPSCYRWKYRQTYCHSLRDFIDASYAGYEAQPIEREKIRYDRLGDGALDRVLGCQLGWQK